MRGSLSIKSTMIWDGFRTGKTVNPNDWIISFVKIAAAMSMAGINFVQIAASVSRHNRSHPTCNIINV